MHWKPEKHSSACSSHHRSAALSRGAQSQRAVAIYSIDCRRPQNDKTNHWCSQIKYRLYFNYEIVSFSLFHKENPKWRSSRIWCTYFWVREEGRGRWTDRLERCPQLLYRSVKVKRELLIYLLIYIPVVTYGPMGCDTKNEMGDRSSGNVSFQGWALT